MNGLARTLGRVLAENSTLACDEDVIRYGLEVFLGGLLQVVLLVALGWWLGLLKELLVVMFSFGVYRRYAGGAHSSAYYRCTIIGLITFPVLAYLCRLIDYQYFWAYFIFVGLFSLAIIYWKAPIDTEVKPIQESSQRRSLKLRAAGLVTLLLIAALLSHLLIQDLIAISILLGVGWQTLTMTRLGAIYTRFWDIILSDWWVNNLGKEEL